MKIVKWLLIMTTLFSFTLPDQKNNEELSRNIIPIEYGQLSRSEFKNRHINSRRMFLSRDQDVYFFYYLSEDNDYIKTNLATGEYWQVKIPGIHTQLRLFNFSHDVLDYVFESSLYSFDFKNQQNTKRFDMRLDKNEFVKSNLYSPYLFKTQDSYFIDYGIKEGINYRSNYALKFFNQDSSYLQLILPEYFKETYIQYDNILIANADQTFFYTFPTDSMVYKWNYVNDEYIQGLGPKTGYLKYDEKKMKDLTYLYEYTVNSSMNMHVLTNSKYLFVVYRYPEENSDFQFSVLVFDHDLNYLFEQTLKHNGYNAFIVNDKLCFLDLQQGEINEYY